MFQIKLNSGKSSRVNGGKESAAEKPIEELGAQRTSQEHQ